MLLLPGQARWLCCRWWPMFVFMTIVVTVLSSNVSARRCTTVLSKKKLQEVVRKDPCIQKFTARCGWLSLEYCTFYHNTFCDKTVNKTVTQYYVVTDCCVGYFEAPNGTCIEKMVGGTVNVVQQNDGHKPDENQVYIRPQQSGSEPTKIKLSRGGYAGIVCGFLFVASVVGFIIIAIRKRWKRQQQAKMKSGLGDGQGQELQPMFPSQSPRTPVTPPSSVTDNSRIESPRRPNQLSLTAEAKSEGDATIFSTPKQSRSPHSPKSINQPIDSPTKLNVECKNSPPSSPKGQGRTDLSPVRQGHGDLSPKGQDSGVSPKGRGNGDSPPRSPSSSGSRPDKHSPPKVRQIAIDNPEQALLLIATPTDVMCSLDDELEDEMVTEVYEDALLIAEPSGQMASPGADEQEKSPLVSVSTGFKPSEEVSGESIGFMPSAEVSSLDDAETDV